MKNLSLFSLFIFLTSCTFDEYGDPHLTSLGLVIIILVIILLIIGFVTSTNEEKRIKNALTEKGYDLNCFIKSGSYIGGHPEIDDKIDRSSIYVSDDYIKIFNGQMFIGSYNVMGKIPKNKVTDIKIEDSSTFEKRVTLGRVLLVGIFALAWKKNKKQDNVFLIIEWNDGRFNHNTAFGFFNKEAVDSANKLRNKLIKLLK